MSDKKVVHDNNMKAIMSVAQARIPVMLVGAPGTGKTQTIKAMAEELEYGLITLVGSRMDPTDISGLPAAATYEDAVAKNRHYAPKQTDEEKSARASVTVQTPDGETLKKEDVEETTMHVTSYHMQWWQAEVLKNKKYIIFLDEFSNTPPSVRASLLTFLQDREFPNGDVLPSETIVIGAMNPVDQAADGSDLDLPTTNRMFFIPWNPPVRDWYNGMLKAWGKKNVSDQEMHYRKMIVDFHKKRNGYLHREPDNENNDDGNAAYGANLADPSESEVFQNAWPSRRSWDNAAVALGKAPKDATVQDIILQGLVGFRAAAAFREFLREKETYDPMEVLYDLDSFDWKDGSPGELSLVIRGIMESKEEKDYEQVMKFFIRVAEEGRSAEGGPYVEPVIKYLSNAVRKHSNRPDSVAKTLQPLLEAYRDVGRSSKNKAASPAN